VFTDSTFGNRIVIVIAGLALGSLTRLLTARASPRSRGRSSCHGHRLRHQLNARIRRTARSEFSGLYRPVSQSLTPA
jgi:hypothetical protein